MIERRAGEEREERQKGRIDPKLIELLVCPLTKTGSNTTPSGRNWSRAPPASPIRSATASRSCCPKRRGPFRMRKPTDSSRTIA